MSSVPKPAGKMYPGVKAVELNKGEVTVTTMKKDNFGGKSFKAHTTGEGTSGPSGGHMGAKKALEKGGSVCKDAEYSAGGVYGKQGKSSTPKFREVK